MIDAAQAPDELRRQSLRRNMHLASAIACAAFVIIYVALGAYLSAWVVAGTGLCMLSAHLGARFGRFVRLTETLASVSSLGAVFAVARNLGGIESPVLVWLPLLPMTAYIRNGKRAGVLVLAGAAVVVVGQVLLPGEQLVSHDTLDIIWIFSLLGMTVFSLTVAVQFERARRAGDALFARANDALARARDEAQEANRLKSEFVASVSHEVRTPLHAMLGMTDLLLDTNLDDKQRELAAAARKAGASLAVLVDDLLDASRLDAGRLVLHAAPADLEEVVRAVAAMFARTAAEKNIALELSVQPNVPKIVIDAGRVRQVLTNLVDNAVKFTDKGRVAIRFTWDRVQDAVVRVRVVVEDTGLGIAPDQADAIFERFKQVDSSSMRRYGGAGLGLAIAKDLMALMGGTLDVKSSPGVGSAFTLTVEAALAAERAPAALTGARVLLAEDNLLNQRLAVHLLESLGCSVDIAHDGAEAVRLVDERRYDVVIMDCHMPTMDGYLAAAAIRKKLGRELPILALTASGSADDVARAREAGMDGFLTKPIDAEGMRSSIASVLQTRQTRASAATQAV